MAFSRRSTAWTGFRSVLCPVDFSECSRLALRYAERIARREKAILEVWYANDPLLVAAAAAALHDRHVAKRSAKELQGFVDSTISSRLRKDLRVRSRVSIGGPSDEIMKAADRTHSDLIVMGTHGLTGADRLLMGSTTLSVLQRTAVPVLAIPRAAETETAPALSWPGERIVAAVELDSSADGDIDRAVRIAQWFGASLLLLHVVDEVARPAWVRGDLSAHDRIRVAHAQTRLDTIAARLASQLKTESRVVCGNIADEIAALTAIERTGLLITALRDRRGWFGAKRGSISYHVLTQATTPVLAYPPQWRPR
jgi:nucleotide-binding universal stress UspA family protein